MAEPWHGGIKVLPYNMTKEKVTLTLNSETLSALRKLVGSRSVSAEVERAVSERVAKLRHLASVDDMLRELDDAHGPVPADTLAWAAKEVAEWSAPVRKQRRKVG
ncbi:MAG: hypothetical protein RL701_3744 [Pseudomonadota bacterium]